MSQRKRDLKPARSFYRQALVFLWRALRLRCPLCGQSPVFLAVRKTRSVFDWLTPLDGCPRCGLAYDRESGYWLVPVWVIGFGFSMSAGLIVALICESTFHPEIFFTTGLAGITTGITAFLFARHAKALFLALDRFCDP